MSQPPALAQPMSARRQLRLAVVHYLRQLAGVNVMSPGIWPTPIDKLPALLVNVPNENKTSKNKGLPEFDTTCSVVVQGQVKGVTPEAAQDAIEQLAYQVENIVLAGYWLVQIVQQFSSITTEYDITSDGKEHLAGFKMTIAAETFEAFDPTVPAPDGSTWPPADPPAIADLQGVNLHVDAIQPADLTGTYPNPPFPSSVTPAPRTQGPDGRDEAYLQIDLPQG